MGTKVKGITIELTADTTGIEKALKDVNKSLGLTSKELSSVNKALKLDPGNTELIEQKQRLLAKAIEQTTQKLNTLNQAQSKVDTSTGNGQSQYDALTREISETAVKLSSLKAEQSAFTAEADKGQTSTTNFATSLQNFSNTAGVVADRTRAISAAAAVAVGAMSALAVKAGDQADEWLTLSQQMGVGVETIQRFQYASELIDVDMNTLTGAFQKMVGTLRTSEQSFERIGVHVRNQNGQLKSNEQIFNETVSALGRIDNETQRDIESMNVFGRSAMELAGLIDDGGKKLAALGEEADSIGAIIPEEDIQKLGEFDDALERIKAQLSAAFVQVALPVMEALQPVLATVANAIKKVASYIAEMDPTLLKVAGIVGVIIAVISPIAGILSNIGMAMLGLQQVVPAVIAGIQAIGQAFMTLASNPYVLMIAAIVAALALLGYAIYEVATNWDSIKEGADSAFNGLRSTISDGASAVANFAQGVGERIANIGSVFSSIGDGFESIIIKIKNVINKIISAFNQMGEKARKAGQDILKKFTEGFESVINSVTNAAQKLANAIKSIWDSMTGDAARAGSQTAQAYATSYNNGSSLIKKPNVFSANPNIGNYSTSATPANQTGNLVSALNNLATALYSTQGGATNVNVELVGSAKNIFDTVRVQNNIMATATGYHALA